MVIFFRFVSNKTNEKGVRQLKSALDSVFDYCLLQWTHQAAQGKTEGKITIDSELIHEIIPHDFSNVDSEKENDSGKQKKELENLRRELATLKGEKNSQSELKAIRFNSLLVLRQVRSQFNEKEYQDYEGKINIATSREEIEVLVKEFLLKTRQKNVLLKPIKEKNGDKKLQDELSKIKDQNESLEGKIKLFDDKIKKLKGDKSSQNQRNQNEILLTIVVIILIIWGIYGMIRLLEFFRKQKGSKKN